MSDFFLRWRPDFNLGIEKIDQQHKKIIELINALNNLFLHENERTEIDNILNELEAYSKYHFASEEKLFLSHNYPFSTEHIQQHTLFIERINKFRVLHNNGEIISLRLLSFLKNWFTNHILDQDREYVDIVKSHNVSPTIRKHN